MEAKKVKYDGISCLPDEILVKIISLLPTKRAASTSLLSKRWRTLFPLMMYQLSASQHHIHLDESDLLYPKGGVNTKDISTSFKSFVDKTLLCGRNNSSNMKKLTLKIRHDNISLDLVDQWIQKALERGLVDLAMYSETTSQNRSMWVPKSVIPPSVFTNKTLVRLTLGYKCDPLQIMGSTVFLPVLKSLFLHGCEVLCNMFLTGCPILEELSLHCFNGVGGLGISHKTLKRLTVHKDNSLHYDHNQNLQQQYQTRLLNTPSLVYLDNSGHVPLFLPKTSNFLDSLVEARLNVRLPQAYNPSYDLVFIPIIDRVHNVKTLCISSTCVQAMNSLRTGVPWFLNLVKLSFESNTEQGWEALPHMLNKSPKLETLLLKGLYCVRKEGVVCADPKEVKVLEIYGFRGNCREFRQLKSFPCQVMKVEIIKADDSKKLQVISRLLDLSQRSSKCQIKLL